MGCEAITGDARGARDAVAVTGALILHGRRHWATRDCQDVSRFDRTTVLLRPGVRPGRAAKAEPGNADAGPAAPRGAALI